MVEAVQSGTGTINYGDLAAKILAIHFEPDSHIFHELLGQISKTEDEEGRGMLSVALIMTGGPGVGKTTMQHGLHAWQHPNPIEEI
jgi:hypothetical protein